MASSNSSINSRPSSFIQNEQPVQMRPQMSVEVRSRNRTDSMFNESAPSPSEYVSVFSNHFFK